MREQRQESERSQRGVREESELSEELDVDVGMHQESVLSPIHFCRCGKCCH